MIDDCCSPQAKATPSLSPKAPCPMNGQVGKRVESLTLKALLAIPLTQLSPKEYRFCQATDCPTVYYSADGGQCFAEADLRERVYQKHPADDDILVCYCFQHTVGGIRDEVARTGASTIVERVVAGIQAGQCACDIRNPQGECCLGNVRRVVQQVEAEFAKLN